MRNDKASKSTLWRSILILTFCLAAFAVATYALAQLPKMANDLASAVQSMRYILFALRLVLLCLLFIFWEPLLALYASNVKINDRQKLKIFAVLICFDILFILQLPFKGL